MIDSQLRRLRLLAVALLLPLAGCQTYAAGHTSSPWEWGAGGRVAPQLMDLGESGATAHPTLGYTYLSFDGGNDQLFEIGGQVRKPMGSATPFWIGGELTLSRLRTSIDFGGSSSTFNTNGWSLTALGGIPFGTSDWNTSVFAGLGISDYGAQGWNVRFGIDVQPTHLWGN